MTGIDVARGERYTVEVFLQRSGGVEAKGLDLGLAVLASTVIHSNFVRLGRCGMYNMCIQKIKCPNNSAVHRR